MQLQLSAHSAIRWQTAGCSGDHDAAVGRIETATTFASVSDLAAAMRRAEAAQASTSRQRTGQRDAEWADWYAEYIVRSRRASRCRSETSQEIRFADTEGRRSHDEDFIRGDRDRVAALAVWRQGSGFCAGQYTVQVPNGPAFSESGDTRTGRVVAVSPLWGT